MRSSRSACRVGWRDARRVVRFVLRRAVLDVGTPKPQADYDRGKRGEDGLGTSRAITRPVGENTKGFLNKHIHAFLSRIAARISAITSAFGLAPAGPLPRRPAN
jgi:hypothetical protein